MDLHVSLDGRRDLSGQLFRQIRAAIVDGRLRPGEAVPSTRELAQRLAMSRNTVALAYDRLMAEGFLASRVGVGTFVSAGVGRRDSTGHPRVGSPLRPRPVWDEMPDPPDLSAEQPEFDFRTGVPDARQFPFATMRALVAAQLRLSAVHTGAHIDAAGHPGLRAAVARHLGVSRAVRATPEDVFVASGSQQAVDLLARVLLEPGDLAAVEDPGYSPVHRAFTAHGARVVGVPVDGEGIVVGAIPEGTRLVYVCPSHQYPLGMAMSLPRRLDLLHWAERAGAAIIEDDYDSEFRYAGRPLEPLQSLDRTGRVLYVGSLSKVMLPTLRLGFVVAPAPLHGALRRAKHVTDWHTAVPMQGAAAQFIDDGLLARHIRRMRGIYAERHHLISAAVDRDLAEHLELIPSAVGLHISAYVRGEGVDDEDVVRRAGSAGVGVHPLSRCAVTLPPRQGLMIGYGAIEADRIPEGLRRLGEALRRSRGA